MNDTNNPAQWLTEILTVALTAALLKVVQRPETRAAIVGAATGASANAGDRVVTKAVAAKVLGVSTSTIDKAVAAGAPYVAVGARRRFDVADLRAWFAARGKRSAGKPVAKKIDVDVAALAERAGLSVAAGSR
jgi:excisionase family DNA binding protein